MSANLRSSIIIERQGAVLVMTIDRPERRNALDGASSRELAAAMDRLDADETLKVGILTGAGGMFCAGMDLKAFLNGDTADLPGRGFGGIVKTATRKPLVAAVEGWAVAGGFELVLSCDLVVAAETAQFGLPEVKRGLVAGGGGIIRLAEQLPSAMAMEILLIGDPLPAWRAAELSLINRVVPSGEALNSAIELAERIVENGPLAVLVTKAIAQRSRDWTSELRWAKQQEILAPIANSDDAKEGATAFAQKRRPAWTGR